MDTEVVPARRTADASPPPREEVVPAARRPVEAAAVPHAPEVEAEGQHAPQAAAVVLPAPEAVEVQRGQQAAVVAAPREVVAGRPVLQAAVAGPNVRRQVVAVGRAWQLVAAFGLRLAAGAFQALVEAAPWLRAAARRAHLWSLDPAFEVAGTSQPAVAGSAGWRLAFASECSASEYSATR